jgi:hypothetical protein
MDQTTSATGEKKKSPVRLIILATVLLVGGFIAYTKISYAMNHEETDNAQVETLLLPVLPRISGYIKQINVRDFDSVIAGQLVAELDDAELLTLKLTIQHKNVAKELTTRKISFFKQAYIYGVKFRSRGSEFRQTEAATLCLGQKNGYNESKSFEFKHWFQKSWYGSWCKYSTLRVNRNKEEFYGQLNGFFSLHSSDIAINGLKVASITSRRFVNSKSTIKQASVDFCRVKNSYDPRHLFISIADVYPTEIGTIPLDGLQRPIEVPMKNRTSKERFFSYQPLTLQEFAMIVLRPEKVSLKPNNTFFKQFY